MESTNLVLGSNLYFFNSELVLYLQYEKNPSYTNDYRGFSIFPSFLLYNVQNHKKLSLLPVPMPAVATRAREVELHKDKVLHFRAFSFVPTQPVHYSPTTRCVTIAPRTIRTFDKNKDKFRWIGRSRCHVCCTQLALHDFIISNLSFSCTLTTPLWFAVPYVGRIPSDSVAS